MEKQLFNFVFTVNCYWLQNFGANFYQALILLITPLRPS